MRTNIMYLPADLHLYYTVIHSENVLSSAADVDFIKVKKAYGMMRVIL